MTRMETQETATMPKRHAPLMVIPFRTRNLSHETGPSETVRCAY